MKTLLSSASQPLEFMDILNSGINVFKFIKDQVRPQVTLLPECLDDYIAESSTVRIVDAFVNELDMAALKF